MAILAMVIASVQPIAEMVNVVVKVLLAVLLLLLLRRVLLLRRHVYAMAKQTAVEMEALTVNQYILGQITPMIRAKLFATLIKANVLVHIHPLL